MGMSTTPAEKAFIRHEIFSLRAKRVLEIGSFKGETTRVLSESVAPFDGVVVAIDPMQWASEAVRNGILRHTSVLRDWLLKAEKWLPLSSYERAFWREVKAAGHDNVRLFRRLSDDPALIADTDPVLAQFDLVFVDGDHSYEGALSDLSNWATRVRAGGTVIVHDATESFPGVCRAIDDWSRDRSVTVDPVRHGSICRIEVH